MASRVAVIRKLCIWKALGGVVDIFLGSYRADNYSNPMAFLLHKCKSMGYRISLELLFWHSYLELFPSSICRKTLT